MKTLVLAIALLTTAACATTSEDGLTRRQRFARAAMISLDGYKARQQASNQGMICSGSAECGYGYMCMAPPYQLGHCVPAQYVVP